MSRTSLAETQESPPLRERSWVTPDFLRLLVATACWGFSFSSFYLLPKYLAVELEAGPRAIGIVMGIFGFATFVAAPFAGRWIDRRPHRDAIVAGALLMALSAFGFLLVESVGAAIVGLRIVQAIAYALVMTALGVAVSDLAPAERLSQALGLAGASTLFMNAIAPAVVESIAAAAGWKAVFLLAAIVALASAALAARIRGSRSGRPDESGAGGLLEVLRRPVAMHYAIVIALAGLVFGTIFTFQPPWALALGRQNVRGFFVAFALAAVGVRIFGGHLPDRIGRHRVATAALGAYAVGTLALAGISPWLFEGVGALCGVAHGLFYPSVNAIAVTAVAPGERGRILAIFTGAFSLGLAGTTLLGVVAATLGYAALFAIVAATTGAGAAFLGRSRELRRAGERPEVVDPGLKIAPGGG